MKSIIVILSILMVAVHCFSQKIPNASFEKWSVESSTYWDLIDWETTANTASIAVQATTGYLGRFGLQLNYGGYAKTNFRCTSEPSSLKAYIKSKIQQNDTSMIHVSFYEGKKKVKTFKYLHHTSVAEWTPIYVVFDNISPPIISDSIEIELFAGKDLGSSFSLDELSFEYESSTQHNDVDDHFNIYPNPNTSHLSIEIGNIPNNAKFLITNSQGKLVKEVHHVDHVMMIDRHDLKKGVYFISLIQNNTILTTKKMIVVD
jgi:Secretion system C-terminal sorting domain